MLSKPPQSPFLLHSKKKKAIGIAASHIALNETIFVFSEIQKIVKTLFFDQETFP